MRIRITNGKLVNPRGESQGDISICDGKIEKIGEPFGEYDRVIDAKGLVVTPGLIDMHVHLQMCIIDRADIIWMREKCWKKRNTT